MTALHNLVDLDKCRRAAAGAPWQVNKPVKSLGDVLTLHMYLELP